MPTFREPAQVPDAAKYEAAVPEEGGLLRAQNLVSLLIEGSEELSRTLLEAEYKAREPLNRGFEQYLRLFIIQLKTFQNELQD